MDNCNQKVKAEEILKGESTFSSRVLSSDANLNVWGYLQQFVRVVCLRRKETWKKWLKGYMCIQWKANSFSDINVPQNSTMMSLWTCREPNSVNYHYRLIRSLFPLSRRTSPSLSTLFPSCSWTYTRHLSPFGVVWLHFSPLQTACALTPSSPLRNPNTAPNIQHKLLTDIWKVSSITARVLIRTSWHILAKTCTYGNSIRKKGERGGEKKKGKKEKGHTGGSWEIRKTEGEKGDSGRMGG